MKVKTTSTHIPMEIKQDVVKVKLIFKNDGAKGNILLSFSARTDFFLLSIVKITYVGILGIKVYRYN